MRQSDVRRTGNGKPPKKRPAKNRLERETARYFSSLTPEALAEERELGQGMAISAQEARALESSALMRPNSKAVVVPLLCEFWHEDGVWNGVARDLPVAVFGKTFELARKHLVEAVRGFMESVIKHGELAATLALLRKAERHGLSVDEIPVSRPFLKLSVEVRDRKSVAVA